MKLAFFALLGALTAVAYTASLAWNAKLYLSSKTASWPVLQHVVRTSAVVAVLVGLARAGAGSLVAALVGFACAHAAAVSSVARSA